MASAVILDLDGTVWDSHPYYAAAVGGSSAAKEKRVLADLKSAVSAATVLKNAGVSETGFRGFCTANVTLMLYAGALETIGKLFERETPLGAVTNLPAWMVDPILACKGLDGMLGSVVTFGRTARKKPWPDPLLLCCEELNVSADGDCWYVGDTEGDGEAARRAGLSFGWASWGYGEHAPAASDLTLSRFADIAGL
jgi:HAD superfamily hydrolase (TIGR01549 family)